MIFTYRAYYYFFSFALITTILLTFCTEGLSIIFMSVFVLYAVSFWVHRKLLGAGFDKNWIPYTFSLIYLYTVFDGTWLILKENSVVFWGMVIFFMPYPIFVLLVNHRSKKAPL